jgi:hypothetical protein
MICIRMAMLLAVLSGERDAEQLDAGRVLSQYKDALERLASEAYAPLRATATRESESSRKDKPSRKFSYTYKFSINDNKHIKIYDINNNNKAEAIYLLIDDRYFTLGRTPDRPDYRLYGAGAPGGPYFQNMEHGLSALHRATYSINDDDIREIIARKGFEARRATRLAHGDGDLIRLDFAVTPPPASPGGSDHRAPLVGGWVVVDRAAGWILRECELRFGGEYSTVIRGSVVYPPSDGSPAIPKSVTYDTSYSNGAGHKVSFHITEIDRQPTPAREFTLDYYGLGDFQSAARPGSNLVSYGLFGLALFALGLGALLRYRNRASAAT